MSDETIALSEQAQQLVEPLEKLIASGVIDVPMLPEVANKALMLAQNPDSDASEMAKLIEGDQSLAAHVMRIANSVAYTPLGNLVSLQQAIARLGMGIISEIALAASIGSKMFNTPGYESYVAQLWKHALATGLWAKEIARHGRSNVEVAFLAGLLHSMGKPALLQAILDLSRQKQLQLDEQSVLALVVRYADQVTSAVVVAWEMPSLVIEAVSFYNNYQSAPTASEQAAQVNAATQYATHMLTPDLLEQESLLKLPVLASLNVYPDEAEGLLGKTEAVKGRLEGMLA